MRPRASRLLGGIVGIAALSRIFGVLREAVIAAGFGFSRATDGFYQLAATPTYLLAFLGGPFTTAWIAWSNRADTPPEAARLAWVGRWLAMAALLLAAGFIAVGSGLAGRATRAGPLWLMALAIPASAAIGLAAAAANGKARFVTAQALLFANNAGFVVLLGLGALLLRGQVELALTAAYAAAALLVALAACAMLRAARGAVSRSERSLAAASARRVFAPMLAMAGAETLGALATQALVLWLAAHSGTGITSAAALSQRIALTVNGLATAPLANVAMVRLMRLEATAARGMLLRVAGLTVCGLGLVAAAISLGAMLGATHAHGLTTVLLCRLLPVYALWLVAQGCNLVLSRLSFARGAARLYTVVTLAGYGCACAMRIALWPRAGFGAAVAAGAAVELAAALSILAAIARGPVPVALPEPAR